MPVRIAVAVMLFCSGVLTWAQSEITEGQQTVTDEGKIVFNQCSVCHTSRAGEAHGVGPNLWNILTRSRAGAEGYEYSKAFQELEGSWNAETLDKFLVDPMRYVPGTKMVFPGIADQKLRISLIAYLHTLDDQPVKLPEDFLSANAAAVPDDPFGPDWPAGAGREFTGHLCNACHSLAIVKQQGLSEKAWDELLDWMVEEQGMSELEPDDRALVVAYLAENFGIDSRRK